MALVRYQPLRGFNQFQDEINKAFSIFDNQAAASNTNSWTPAVDITEYKDRYSLAVELPGISPESVDITVDEGVLEIQGERVDNTNEENVVYRRAERRAGHFHRKFHLPETADLDGVTANNKDGVLEINIPKQEKAQPRKIEVAIRNVD